MKLVVLEPNQNVACRCTKVQWFGAQFPLNVLATYDRREMWSAPMNLHSWTGLAAARLAVGSKELKRTDRQHQFVSAMVGFLLAIFIAVALLALLSG